MLSVRNLTKRYGHSLVLDDISFDLPQTGITFLMGENGAGKTTLIKAMLGLERYQGEVLYDGRDLRQVSTDVAVVFDDAPSYRGLNGYRNLELLCPRKVPSQQLRDAAREYLGDDLLRKNVRRYSYGQRKKLSIACALLARPKYLIMDEVSNGLDYETMEHLKGEFRERARESAVFLTGHQFDFYTSIVSRVLVLKGGKIREFELDEQPTPTQSPLGQLYERTVKDVS
ncbi:MAG: ABC transporter ATP-binding protein [Coriobacteriia bacterium]|nr:ABC transporter ATP-binding protein [Coriobacteriia bacterium]